MKESIASVIITVGLAVNFTGCVDAVGVGVAEVALQHGVDGNVKSEEKKAVVRANSSVTWWKIQRVFGCGPLADVTEENEAELEANQNNPE